MSVLILLVGRVVLSVLKIGLVSSILLWWWSLIMSMCWILVRGMVLLSMVVIVLELYFCIGCEVKFSGWSGGVLVDCWLCWFWKVCCKCWKCLLLWLWLNVFCLICWLLWELVFCVVSFVYGCVVLVFDYLFWVCCSWWWLN